MATKILIVEDERITAEDIHDTLLHLGYNVVGIASSSTEALRQAEQFSPDLALMDIRLEGEMDGIEAATQIRGRFHIPVIYLTAYYNKEVLDRAKVTDPNLAIAIETGLIIRVGGGRRIVKVKLV